MNNTELIRLMHYSDEIMTLFDDKEKMTTSDFQGALDALVHKIIVVELKIRHI